MDTADASEMAAFNEQQAGFQPGRLHVRFFSDAEPDNSDEAKTQGRRFKPATYIEIQIPGNVRETRSRPMREIDVVQFPREYAAFKQNQEAPQVGTPLDKVPFLDKAQILEFHARKLRTAEQVRDMPDELSGQFMGIRALQKRLGDYLAAAAGNAPLEKMRGEIETQDATIAALKSQVEALVKAAEKKK